MRIAVAKQSHQGETRVASVPDLIGKLTAVGNAKETTPRLLNVVKAL